MGTRSAVGVRNENGQYKGRYIHWDGYPSWVGLKLRELIDRDGVQQVVKTIVLDNYGWSNLNPREEGPLSTGYSDGRFKVVPYYGIAYTTEQNQSTPDDWIEEPGDLGTEWLYLIEEDGSILVKGGNPDWVPLEVALKEDA